MSKKKKVLIPIIVVSGLILVFTLVQVFADPGTPADFEIDGNTAQDDSDYDDWVTVINGTAPNWNAGPGILIRDGSSGPKAVIAELDTFAKGGKFADPTTWTIEPGNTPAQNDLTNVYIYPVLPTSEGEHVWMVMGMERIKKQGTFDLDFEYNQVAWDGSSGTLVRTPGDISIGFELSGNPDDPQTDLEVLIIVYDPADPTCGAWEAVYGESWCQAFRGPAAALGGFGEATMNAVAFDQPPWGSFQSSGAPLESGDKIQPFFFAEAAIDLTALGLLPGCPGFGSVHAKSRSSLEIKADLKDLSGPVSLDIDCWIEGHKYLDVDGDGEWDAGEPALEGWEIQLSGAANATAFTDSNGYYKFGNLSDGTYAVNEVCPSGWTQTGPSPTNGCGSGIYPGISIDIFNPVASDKDFLNFENVDVTACKYEDYDGDGGKDAPIAGWTVNLTIDGAIDDTQVTGADGCYIWENLGPLAAGSYYDISETFDATEWTATSPTEYDFESPPQSGALYSGDFTNFENVDITACKVEDADGDLVTTDDQTPIEGWTIELYDNGDMLDTQTTGADGCYTWINLIPGSYRVVEVLRNDWTQLDATPTHDFGTVTSGGGPYTHTFHNFKNVDVEVCKVEDGDGDLTTTGDQTAKSSWEVYLYKNDVLSETETTAENGCYKWTNLGPGSYKVGEDTPAGWTMLDASPTHDFGSVTSGGGPYTHTFHNFKNVDVEVCKVVDADGDLTTSGDQTSKPGWEVYLYKNDVLSETEITAGNGCYKWTDLGPGSYKVEEETRAGWTALDDFTYHDFGTVTSSGGPYSHTFHNFKKVDVTACKYEDYDGDGDMDAPIPGWTVYLTIDGERQDSQVTEADGCYTWTNLGPLLDGSYYDVEEDDPAPEWTATSPLSVDFESPPQSGASYVGNFTNFENVDVTACKYEDYDGDGDMDAPIAGWTVYLTIDDAIVDTQVTGAGGCYTWTNLGPLPDESYYDVEEDDPGPEWTATSPLSVDFESPPQSGALYVGNFTNFENVDVTACKYEDFDGDGDMDAPIPGWTVYLTIDGVRQESQVTGSNGCYTWTNLGPLPDGSYYDVEEDDPAPEWTATSLLSVDFESPPQSGASYVGNFTNFENVDVTACKVEDADGNLSTTDDRSPVEGWTVYLSFDGARQTPGQLTGADGCYTWSDLGPGHSYDVEEDVPAGWTALTPTSHDFGPAMSGQSYTWTFINYRNIYGCTPGFWQGGAGKKLWNSENDPQWTYGGTNPFIHTTLFNAFFSGPPIDLRLDGQTMMQIVSNDSGIANVAEKAARNMVAAYLNESAFPGTFPADSLLALETEWYAAVNNDAALAAFHTKWAGYNNPPGGTCPLP